jgi:DNA-binding transcriptional regulator of glucitol operon
VRERWLSRRAVFLHLGCLLFVPFCIAATWWQITRAEDGNGLSYLYTFEWPVFALVGIYFWWQFLHTDYEKVGLKGMRNQVAANAESPESQPGQIATEATTLAAIPALADAADPVPITTHGAPQVQFDEDPELAAYNARLAALASRGGRTWRKPEAHVARRPQ